jgi:hypothetical protein
VINTPLSIILLRPIKNEGWQFELSVPLPGSRILAIREGQKVGNPLKSGRFESWSRN